MPMPSPSRRGFFGFLGGALAGGKKAAEKAVAELSNLDGAMRGTGWSIDTHAKPLYSSGPEPSAQTINLPKFNREVLKLLPKSSWPAWVILDLKQKSEVHHIDFDLANSPFMSLAAKVSTQRRRNAVRVEEEFFSRPWRQMEKWFEENGYSGSD